MNLLELQRDMRGSILGDDEPAGPLAPGIAVYRNAYRSRLLDALKASFERTLQWAGEASFEAAACHHIILGPPSSWTLDDYGAGFDLTLAEVFAEDPEVAELAWLEWHMSRAFAAPDCPVVDPGELLSGRLARSDWDAVRIELVTSYAARQVDTACATLWLALGDGNEGNVAAPEELILPDSEQIIVWRKQLSPHFRIVEADEFAALSGLAGGATFGTVCAELAGVAGRQAAVMRIGTWLGQWLQDGLIARISSG